MGSGLATVKLMRRSTKQTTGVSCNIETRSRNHRFREEVISITYSECVFFCHSYHAHKAHASITLSVVYPSLPFFPHYLLNSTIFGKKRYSARYVCFHFL